MKPEAWFQRSVWRADDPVVRIGVLEDVTETASPWSAPKLAEHWNWPQMEKTLLRVQVQTNCASVELMLNDRNFGTRRTEDFPNAAPVWFVPYVSGTIEAIGRNGRKVVARHVLRTSGPVARVMLTADRVLIAADGQDVAHVEARLVDAKGIPVPDDQRSLHFAVSGPGKIIGVDNGDLTSIEPYEGSSRTTRNGRALVIVQSDRKVGLIRLSAASRGLPRATVSVKAGRSKSL
jgi:beta-galactosidase